MTWTIAEPVAVLVRMAFAFPACIRSNLRRVISGCVTPTFRTARTPDPLLWRKQVLAENLARAQRQHRQSKAIYSALRAVNHEILSRGVK